LKTRQSKRQKNATHHRFTELTRVPSSIPFDKQINRSGSAMPLTMAAIREPKRKHNLTNDRLDPVT
jgi:hypothetical protein